jgi:Xaa-Pro aminopeptidase
MALPVAEIQRALAAADLDGWLRYDFRNTNDLAVRVLGLDPDAHRSRRWLYLIPATGEPVGFVHAIESGALDGLPGTRERYLAREEWEAAVGRAVAGRTRIAMEYAPNGRNPYVAKVDAGTVELVRASGVEIVSSADLVQVFASRWPEAAYPLYRRAAKALIGIKDDAFAMVSAALHDGSDVTERSVARFILQRMEAAGLEPVAPIVGFGANAGNPHFETLNAQETVIGRDGPLLIDLFSRVAGEPDAAVADFTFMAWTGSAVSDSFGELWRAVAGARNAAVELVRASVASGERLEGWQIDRAARDVIERAGYGEAFMHRTGHSLGRETHDIGMNVDGLEMMDERAVIPGIAFTIEPGIYLERTGLRSEVNVLVHADEIEVWANPMQAEPTLLI